MLNHSFIISSIHAFINSPIHHFTHSLIHQLINSPIYQFIHSLIHPLINLPTQQFIHVHSPIHPLVNSPTRQFTYLSIHPFINSPTHQFINSIRQFNCIHQFTNSSIPLLIRPTPLVHSIILTNSSIDPFIHSLCVLRHSLRWTIQTAWRIVLQRSVVGSPMHVFTCVHNIVLY